jgi:hypothetical protein
MGWRRGAGVKFVPIGGDHDAVPGMRIERDDGKTHGSVEGEALAAQCVPVAHFTIATNRSVRRAAPGATHVAKRVSLSKLFNAASKRIGSPTFS